MRKILSIGLWLCSTVALSAEAPLCFRWELGAAEDLDATKPACFSAADRVGNSGAEGATKFREMKPKVYQCPWVMPAFDFDAANHGALNHAFYLTIKFKDLASAGIAVFAGKGGDGFYGKGFIGSFGGAADGQWKEETLIIPRSMMRCLDGKTFTFSANNVTAAVPVSSMLLFSAAARGLEQKDELIKAAHALDLRKRDALRARLLDPNRPEKERFKDLGLPDPGPNPEYTADEKARGFRVFFPPVHRQLFANSNPREGELKSEVILQACPGEFESLLIAVRPLKNLGKLSLELSDLTEKGPAERDKVRPPVTLSQTPVFWARYSEQKIGSSWGKEYRLCAERLSRGAPEAKPEQLEIACISFKLPEHATGAEYCGTLKLASAQGGSLTLPIRLRPYPFKLEHPEHSTHGLFYYIAYGNFSPFELQDMRDHGMDTLVADCIPPLSPGEKGSVKMDLQPVKKAFETFKNMGFRSPLMCGSGSIYNLSRTNSGSKEGSDQHRKAYASVIQAIKVAAEEQGFKDTGFFPIDEPHTDPKIKDATLTCTWTRDVAGAKTFITSNPKAVKIIQPVLDYVCYNLTYLKPETIEGVKAANATLMFYCPSIDVNPERNRYRAGFYLSKLGAQSILLFAYMLQSGDWYCDLDGETRDWNVVFPSMDSPLHDPTLEWEALREGVDDYCYAYTLKAMAARAKAQGKHTAADGALKLLETVLQPVSVIGEDQKTPELAIEANVGLKDTQLDAEKLKVLREQMPSNWYDDVRQKIAAAIVKLQTAQ